MYVYAGRKGVVGKYSYSRMQYIVKGENEKKMKISGNNNQHLIPMASFHFHFHFFSFVLEPFQGSNNLPLMVEDKTIKKKLICQGN